MTNKELELIRQAVKKIIEPYFAALEGQDIAYPLDLVGSIDDIPETTIEEAHTEYYNLLKKTIDEVFDKEVQTKRGSLNAWFNRLGNME